MYLAHLLKWQILKEFNGIEGALKVQGLHGRRLLSRLQYVESPNPLCLIQDGRLGRMKICLEAGLVQQRWGT
jgi:hypothetical protein